MVLRLDSRGYIEPEQSTQEVLDYELSAMDDEDELLAVYEKITSARKNNKNSKNSKK